MANILAASPSPILLKDAAPIYQHVFQRAVLYALLVRMAEFCVLWSHANQQRDSSGHSGRFGHEFLGKRMPFMSVIRSYSADVDYRVRFPDRWRWTQRNGAICQQLELQKRQFDSQREYVLPNRRSADCSANASPFDQCM
jgi:hypothetical protein